MLYGATVSLPAAAPCTCAPSSGARARTQRRARCLQPFAGLFAACGTQHPAHTPLSMQFNSNATHRYPGLGEGQWRVSACDAARRNELQPSISQTQVWDPVLITAQIVSMQCLFYIGLALLQLLILGAHPHTIYTLPEHHCHRPRSAHAAVTHALRSTRLAAAPRACDSTRPCVPSLVASHPHAPAARRFAFAHSTPPSSLHPTRARAARLHARPHHGRLYIRRLDINPQQPRRPPHRADSRRQFAAGGHPPRLGG